MDPAINNEIFDLLKCTNLSLSTHEAAKKISEIINRETAELHAAEPPADSQLKEWFPIISDIDAVALIGIIIEFINRHEMTAEEMNRVCKFFLQDTEEKR